MLRPLLIAGLVLAVGACASEPRRRDFHGLGRPPGAEARFQRLFISPSGEPFRGADPLGAWFASADADHDGAISRAEFEADALRFFQRLDVNKDGQIDGFEMQAYERDIAPEITATEMDRQAAAGSSAGQPRPGGGGRRGGGMGRGGGGRGGGGRRGGEASNRGPAPAGGVGREGAARYSLINEPEPIANADENLDSRVSLEEWKHATARRFNALDKARTGRLTLDALKGKVPPPKP